MKTRGINTDMNHIRKPAPPANLRASERPPSCKSSHKTTPNGYCTNASIALLCATCNPWTYRPPKHIKFMHWTDQFEPHFEHAHFVAARECRRCRCRGPSHHAKPSDCFRRQNRPLARRHHFLLGRWYPCPTVASSFGQVRATRAASSCCCRYCWNPSIACSPSCLSIPWTGRLE